MRDEDREGDEQQPDDQIVEQKGEDATRAHAVIGADIVEPAGDDLAVEGAGVHSFAPLPSLGSAKLSCACGEHGGESLRIQECGQAGDPERVDAWNRVGNC